MLRQRLKEGGEESQSRSHSAENTKRQGSINSFRFLLYVTLPSLPLDIAQRAALTRSWVSGLVHLNLSSHPQPERPSQRVSSSS